MFGIEVSLTFEQIVCFQFQACFCLHYCNKTREDNSQMESLVLALSLIINYYGFRSDERKSIGLMKILLLDLITFIRLSLLSANALFFLFQQRAHLLSYNSNTTPF